MSRYTGALWGLVIFIIAWQLAVTLAGVPKWLLPAPTDVIFSIAGDYRLILSHAAYTLAAAVAGFLLAVVSGMVLALAMDYWPALESRLYPLLVVSQTVPIITVAPLIIIWLGYGLLPKVVVAALVCFFPLTVSITGGMRGTDPDLADLMKVMGASRWQVIRLARLPSALPSFFSGLKISATYSVMGAVIGEWVGSSSGLGVVLTRASHSYQTGRVFAVIAAIVAMSLAMFLVVEALARICVPWYYRKRE